MMMTIMICVIGGDKGKVKQGNSSWVWWIFIMVVYWVLILLPHAFLNDFCLYAHAFHSILNRDKLLYSISISFHLFFCISLVLDLFSSQIPCGNNSLQLQLQIWYTYMFINHLLKKNLVWFIGLCFDKVKKSFVFSYRKYFKQLASISMFKNFLSKLFSRWDILFFVLTSKKDNFFL